MLKISEMTAEEMRILCAEECGYVNVHRFNKWREGGPMRDGELIGDIAGTPRRINRQYIPNYANDLNAMMNAEASLTAEEHHVFCAAVCGLIGVTPLFVSMLDLRQFLKLTALNRLKAFLIAKGLAQ